MSNNECLEDFLILISQHKRSWLSPLWTRGFIHRNFHTYFSQPAVHFLITFRVLTNGNPTQPQVLLLDWDPPRIHAGRTLN